MRYPRSYVGSNAIVQPSVNAHCRPNSSSCFSSGPSAAAYPRTIKVSSLCSSSLQRCKAVRKSVDLHGGGGQSKPRAASPPRARAEGATFLAQTLRVYLLWSTKKEGQAALEKKFPINTFPGEPGNRVSLAQNILKHTDRAFTNLPQRRRSEIRTRLELCAMKPLVSGIEKRIRRERC